MSQQNSPSKLKSFLSKDLPASFVVFLVALPLSLGIALGSGAPIKSGLIAAIIGGIVVGLTSGAPLQVSGPAAGLTVMVFGFIQHYGLEKTFTFVLGAGVLQMIFGAIGVASLTLIISPAVIHAMLAGIGILIALGQFHVLLGHLSQGSAIKNIMYFPQSILEVNPKAFIIGAITFFSLIAWKKWGVKKITWMPETLFAVIIGTLFSLIGSEQIPRVHIDSHIFDHFQLPFIVGLTWTDFLMASCGLFLVASAESLLCAVATDKLHGGPRCNLNRELFAQGLGNFISGLMGGLPITGVIVRSSANIAAGAQSRFSSVFHGIWLLIFATLFAQGLNQIPLAVLAALLIHIGLNLVKLKEMKHVMAFNEFFIYFLTLCGVVFINLLAGIGIGLALSVFKLLYNLRHISINIEENGDKMEVTLKGNLTFVCVPYLTKQLRTISPNQTIYLSFDVYQIDLSAIEAIRSWKTGYEKTGGTVHKEPLQQFWKDTWKHA